MEWIKWKQIYQNLCDTAKTFILLNAYIRNKNSLKNNLSLYQTRKVRKKNEHNKQKTAWVYYKG